MIKSAYFICLLLVTFFAGCNFFTDDIEPDHLVVCAPTSNTEYNAGDTVTIKWIFSGDRYYDVYISLYRDGVFEESIGSYYSSYDYDTISCDWVIPTSIESDSTYQIRVRYSDYNELADFSDSFIIKGIESDSFEVDDQSNLANLLPVGITQEHSLLNNDSDWVKIPVKAGNLYRVSTNSVAITHYVYLFTSANGTFKSSDYGTANEINYNALSDDTIYVLVKPYNSSSNTYGNYTIEVEEIKADDYEDDDFYTQANLIIADSTQSHSILVSDIDWMKIPVKAGNVYSVSTISDFNHYLYLYLNPESSYISNTNGSNLALNVSPTIDDTLYIKVSNYSSSSTYYGNYDITVTVLKNDKYEDDNNYKNANLILLDSVQSHTIVGNDSDWVKIPVMADRIYEISTISGVKHYLNIFDDIQSSVVTSSNSNLNTVHYTSTENDTLYILVKNYSSSASYSGSYTIKVSTLSNVDMDIFTSPTAGDTVITSGSYRYIQWKSSNVLLSSSVSLDLYRNGRVIRYISSSTSNDGSFSWNVPSTIETGDNYRIKLVNYNSSQNISFFSDTFTIIGQTPDAYEDDDTKSMAKLISSDTVQNRTIMYNDSDWVKIPVIGGKAYKVATSANINHYLSLFKKNSTSKIKSTSGMSNSLIYNATETDTLYAAISISSSNSSTYDYILQTSTIEEDTVITFNFPKADDIVSTASDTTVSYSNFSAYGNYLNLYLYWEDSSVALLSTASYEPNDGSFNWQVQDNLMSGSKYRLYIVNSLGDKFAFSDTFSIEGVEADVYENDNLKDSATALINAQYQTHTIVANDSDWVKFSVDSGMIYTLNSYSPFLHDLKIYLKSSTKCIDSANGKNVNITYEASASDTIFALVSNAQDIGSYSIIAKSYQPDSLVKFTEPTSTSVYNAGSTYSLEWELVSSLFNYAYVYLYKGDKLIQKLTSYVANSDSKTYSWSIPDNLETGSDYVISVQDDETVPTIKILSDSFSISGVIADQYEDDDTITEAHLIGTDLETHTLTLNDGDWFSFNGIKDSVYIFDKVSSGKVKLLMYDDSGKTSEFSTTLNKQVWICDKTSPYFFYIDQSNNSDATGYTIQVSEYSTNNELLPVSSPGVGDTVTAGSSTQISWGNSSEFSDEVDIYLYKGGTISSTIVSNVSNYGAYNWFISQSLEKGEYSIRVISRISSKIYGNSGIFIVE